MCSATDFCLSTNGSKPQQRDRWDSRLKEVALRLTVQPALSSHPLPHACEHPG